MSPPPTDLIEAAPFIGASSTLSPCLAKMPASSVSHSTVELGIWPIASFKGWAPPVELLPPVTEADGFAPGMHATSATIRTHASQHGRSWSTGRIIVDAPAESALKR